MSVLLKIRGFGVFGVFAANGESIVLGAKHQALMALLSKADSGVRTRAFLENILWSSSQPEQAKAGLRTALSTLRRHLGSEASQLLTANRERVVLDLNRVGFIGSYEDGAFMEGFELPYQALFRDWLTRERDETTYRIPRRQTDLGFNETQIYSSSGSSKQKSKPTMLVSEQRIGILKSEVQQLLHIREHAMTIIDGLQRENEALKIARDMQPKSPTIARTSKQA
ncbi:AfsR/SARP family transcriptional regulator [Parasedimentitalea psychrophila]|uniref:AfsR/SARP family transcriptional regulator n=1 Tax=Parasedimentitalea psychrophila TaxID=2997337 RepID=UPI0028BDE476|nr:hypothetical protein [Parasedimentitalea psychrophila]